jgi:hypothetical protein
LAANDAHQWRVAQLKARPFERISKVRSPVSLKIIVMHPGSIDSFNRQARMVILDVILIGQKKGDGVIDCLRDFLPLTSCVR